MQKMISTLHWFPYFIFDIEDIKPFEGKVANAERKC